MIPFQFEPASKIEGLARTKRTGAKTVKGDLITWRGTWEGRPLVFQSEPKADPTIHFRTSSNARIHFQRPIPNYVEIRLLSPRELEPASAARLLDYLSQYDERSLKLAEPRSPRRG